MANTSEGSLFYTSASRPYGLTYGQWTVEWWRWFLSTPAFMNPVLDWSGKLASVNQPRENVWFLAGKVGNENKNIPKRYCSIPSSHSILFPIINCEANFLESPEMTTERDLIEHVSADENTIVLKECLVDNNPVITERVRSDPEIFEVQLNEDNAYSVKGGGNTVAAADGYWVFLKPLKVGRHFIYFRGSCENGILRSGAQYVLEVFDARY
jgi:hypothetical protein